MYQVQPNGHNCEQLRFMEQAPGQNYIKMTQVGKEETQADNN